MRTLVITSYPPAWDALAEVTCQTHFEWCQRHGYDYHADRSDLRDNVWNPYARKEEKDLGIAGFRKLDLFLHFMERGRYDRILWIDADALVTNYALTIEQIFGYPDERPTDIILPEDWNGHNATIIFAYCTPIVRKFFWACNNSGRKLFLLHDWKEMEAMRYFAQTPPYDHLIEYLPIKDLCSLLVDEYKPYVPDWISEESRWAEGDWCLHLSALHIERRTALAREYAQRIVR